MHLTVVLLVLRTDITPKLNKLTTLPYIGTHITRSVVGTALTDTEYVV